MILRSRATRSPPHAAGGNAAPAHTPTLLLLRRPQRDGTPGAARQQGPAHQRLHSLQGAAAGDQGLPARRAQGDPRQVRAVSSGARCFTSPVWWLVASHNPRRPTTTGVRFYGCGTPLPLGIDGLRVLDLGCGTGRDCYVAARLVGPSGHVTGAAAPPSHASSRCERRRRCCCCCCPRGALRFNARCGGAGGPRRH